MKIKKRFNNALLITMGFTISILFLVRSVGYASCFTSDITDLLAAIGDPEAKQCQKDEKGRYIIFIDGMVANASQINLITKLHLLPASKDKESGIVASNVPAVVIPIAGNIIEGLTINKGSFGIFIKNLDNKITNNKILSFLDTGIFVHPDLHKALGSEGGEEFLFELLCTNTIIKDANTKYTNLDLNNDGKDDYSDYWKSSFLGFGSKCQKWFSEKAAKETLKLSEEIGAAIDNNPFMSCGKNWSGKMDNGKCVCTEGYKLGADDKCSECADSYYLKDNVCVLCSSDENKAMKDDKCGCKDGFEVSPADSGLCVKECAGNEVRDDKGECFAECPEYTHKVDNNCICDSGYASYNGMNNVPCVKCGTNSSTGISAGGECKCKNSYHVSLNGACVSDSADFSCVNDDPNAIFEDKKCVCKPQFAYAVDPNGKPYCEMIPCTVANTEYYEAKGECLGPDIIACLEKGMEWDDGAGKCVSAEAGGDCNCNFTGGEPTFAQALMPFIAILFGTGGMMVWRKKKG